VANRLIIFTRYPEFGRVKTRLVPLLGPAGATELHCRLTRHTIAWGTELSRQYPVEVEVHFDGGSVDAMVECFGSSIRYCPQSTGDLGDRLTEALAERTEPTVVIGTDCPGLVGGHVRQAFDALRDRDLVIGPARDGGYYLIGLRRATPEIYQAIDWGTDRVCQQTLLIATQNSLSVELLECLNDVDRPEDLKILDRRFLEGSIGRGDVALSRSRATADDSWCNLEGPGLNGRYDVLPK
jgi:rSAM/selenodomain-associated transferase 1